MSCECEKNKLDQYANDLLEHIAHTLEHYFIVNEKKEWFAKLINDGSPSLKIKSSLAEPFDFDLWARDTAINIVFSYEGLDIMRVSLIRFENGSFVTMPHLSNITETVISILDGIAIHHKNATRHKNVDNDLRFLRSLLNQYH